uniref:Uncharacterized protein n=1 Tax=Triticum urartu TaxID=4572 RepID=A0A8R7Q498_TRIUA
VAAAQRPRAPPSCDLLLPVSRLCLLPVHRRRRSGLLPARRPPRLLRHAAAPAPASSRRTNPDLSTCRRRGSPAIPPATAAVYPAPPPVTTTPGDGRSPRPHPAPPRDHIPRHELLLPNSFQARASVAVPPATTDAAAVTSQDLGTTSPGATSPYPAGDHSLRHRARLLLSVRSGQLLQLDFADHHLCRLMCIFSAG